MWMLLPGVYRPQQDTRFLADALAAARPRHADVLDVGTGSGALAVAAMHAGARSVTAIDICARAALTAWLNTRLRRLPVRVLHGDLRAVAGRRFDLVVANPPYVPSGVRTRGAARAWDAGPDGREVLGPLCASVPRLLRPGGMLLLVQSALAGTQQTLDDLRRGGLQASVIARRRQPFGPVMLGRASWLERTGLIPCGQRHEELVVIRAQR